MTIDAPPRRRATFGAAAVVGLAAGALSGLFGVGGGLIIVPGLIGIAGFDRRLAHGTSLGATLPIASASLITYIAQGKIDWTVAALLVAGSVWGAVLGTHLLHVVSKRVLTIVFVVTILATAVRLVSTSDVAGRSDLTAWSALLLVAVGLVAGTLAGMLGIGGGVVMVPVMVVLYDMVPVVAKGTSVAVIVPTSSIGTIRNRRNGNVDLRAAAIVGITGMVSAVAGALVAGVMSDQLSNVLFAVLLVVVAATQLLSLRSAPE
jgi:uncharacterized membrane protein YfcA